MTIHETVFGALQVPADDEWFNLEVDNDKDPAEVLTSIGYNPNGGWKYSGPELAGKHTYRVKLVQLGYVRNLEEASRRAKRSYRCRLLEGQAHEAFRAKYSVPDGVDCIAFGGSEWQCPGILGVESGVVCIHDNGGAWSSVFSLSSPLFDWDERTRWAVVSKDS